MQRGVSCILFSFLCFALFSQQAESGSIARQFSVDEIALYLKTSRLHLTQTKQYNFAISMKAGSCGLVSPSILYEQRLTQNIHLSANFEYTYATGKYPFRYRRLLPNAAMAWDAVAVRQNGE